jgi:putative oxidoreductase
MRADDLGKLILRLAVGGLLIFHGISKIQHGIDWLPGMLAAKGLPDWVRFGVYIGEVVGPLLVIIGLFSRLGGFAIMVNMGMAIFLAKSGDIATLNPKSGGLAIELELLFLCGGLAILLLGSGRFGLRKGIGPLD